MIGAGILQGNHYRFDSDFHIQGPYSGQHYVLSSLEGQRATSIRGVIVTCSMLQDAVYRVDRQKPDCMRSGAGVCYLLLISQSCLIDTPETAYLYDPSVQNSRLDFCFCQVRRCHLLHSTSRMHAHVLLHIQSYIHSFISLYIVLANPTLTFFGQEDQTAYYISATTSAIE
jgi:hypothetical protein